MPERLSATAGGLERHQLAAVHDGDGRERGGVGDFGGRQVACFGELGQVVEAIRHGLQAVFAGVGAQPREVFARRQGVHVS
jgi:hypothetical protein